MFLVLVMVTGCVSKSDTSMLVIPYEDFSPQVLAYPYIGYEWYQWESHGDSNPNTRYDIKVVVYSGLSLREVERRYPVDETRKQDYRYLTLPKAMEYLIKTRAIAQQSAEPELQLPHLEQTRQRLQQHFKCF